MMRKSAARSALRYRVAALLPLVLATGLAGLSSAAAQQTAVPPKPAQTAPAIEPKALAILEAAGNTLASARTMSFTAVNTYEKACAYAPYGAAAYYNCGGTWLAPAYGASGVYYRVVPAP